ncbi:MAG: hypothetical protein EBU03_04280 [Methylophilaceae bacterium]|nr:hypothetical protein [Methylophilaceae bacterium]
MANTFELIASSTVGSGGAANIDFTSIASTWTDLVLKVSGRSTASFTRRTMRVTINNSVTASDYADRYLLGSGSAASSSADAAGSQSYIVAWDLPAATGTANTFANIEIYIPNYASTSAYKSLSIDGVGEENGTTAYMGLVAGIYNQNTAISRITVAPDSGNFAQYSTAYLYGVNNA